MLFPRSDTVKKEVSDRCFVSGCCFRKSCTCCLKEAVRAAVCFLFQWGLCCLFVVFVFCFPPPRGYHDRDLATENPNDIIVWATFRGGVGYLLASAVLLVLRVPLRPKP